MTPLFAETFADNVNWSLIAAVVMTLATVGMWMDSRKSHTTEISPSPLTITGSPLSNAELQRDLKNINYRIKALEEWRGELITKLDDDKTEILNAGEARALRIADHVESVRRELDEKIGHMPNAVVALLKNTGAI